ncbi:MAG: hypothetical protein PVH19_04615, partial [Planctomycetia bacterium]
MSRLILNPIADSYVLVAVITIALFVLLILRPPIEPRRRRVLTTLRVVAILLLLLVMLRPTIVRMEEVPQAATLMILSDVSRSMTVPDEAGGEETRYVAMKEALDSAAEPMAKLDERFEVKAFAFSGSLKELQIDEGRLNLPKQAD